MCATVNLLSAVSKLQSTHCAVTCRPSGIIHRLIWQTWGVRSRMEELMFDSREQMEIVFCKIPSLLPVSSLRGLLGAELTCRWTATEVGVMLKEAWRAILDLLRSWPAVGCVASGQVTAAAFTVFPKGKVATVRRLRFEQEWQSHVWVFSPSDIQCALSLILTGISRVVEFHRAEPLEGRLPASLLTNVHLLYEA